MAEYQILTNEGLKRVTAANITAALATLTGKTIIEVASTNADDYHYAYWYNKKFINIDHDKTTPNIMDKSGENNAGSLNLASVISSLNTPIVLPAPTYSIADNWSSISLSIPAEYSAYEIRYTLDGSTPTATSTLYTAPIPVTSTEINIHAITVDPNGVVSPSEVMHFQAI